MEYFKALLAPVGIPLVLITLISNYSKLKSFVLGSQDSIVKRPFTAYDKVAVSGLALACFFYVLCATLCPVSGDLYSVLRIDANTPSFTLKRACVGQSPETLSLCDMLIGNDNRNIYQVHGASLTDCTWCKSNNDHVLYNLPNLISWYSTFVAVIGVCTANWRRIGWRYGIAAVLFFTFALEIGMASTDEPYRDLPWNLTQYSLISKARVLLFASICGFLLVVGRIDSWTDKEVVKNMITTTNDTRFKYLATDAMEYARMSNPILKAQWMKHEEDLSEKQKSLHKMPVIKDTKRNLLLRHNMPALRQASSTWSDNLFRLLGHPETSSGNVEVTQPWIDVE